MSIELRGGSGTGNGTQEMLRHNDSIPVEEKEETSPPPSNQQSVSFYKLYSFADGLDYVLMLVGGIAAAIHGAAIPIFFIFFGKLIHTMGTASGNLALVSTEVAKYSMDFFYLGLVVMLAGWMEVSCWMITGDRQSSRMRTKYLGALMKQDVGFFDTGISTGEIVVGISSDTALVQEAIGEKVGNYIHYISRFIAGFAVGFSSVWKLTLVTLSVVPCIAFAGGVYAYIMIGLTSKSQKAYIKAGAIAEEAIAQIRTVHSFVGEEKVAKSYSRALSTTLKLGTKGGLTKGIGVGVMYGLLFCSWALLLWYSGLLVRHGIINGGQAITTIFTVIISALALGQAAPDLTAFGKAKVAGYTILEMIKRKPEIVNNDTHGIKLTTVEGHIEFRNVSFSYPSRVDARIFEDFSLNIPAGKVTALVGSSGSGKSTVISLIERFYDPSSGEVLLDGRNIRELQLRWLRQQIGLVSQEPALFATSIRENISYGKDDPSMEEIEQATKVSGAYVFISQLPNGFDTQVGERGVQLSGGQKQRIAIARALLKNPSILLLDEATSALDAVSEKGVQEALDIAMVGRTSIVVAHRLSTIRNADVIAVVQRGQVVEIGIHDELMTSSVGTYASLVKLQEAGSKQQQQQYQDGAKIAGSHSRLSNGSMSRRTFSFHLSVQSEKDFGGVGTKPDGEIERSAPRPSLKRLLMLNLPEWPYGLLGILGAILAGAQNPLFSLTISHALVAFYSTDNAYIKEEVLKIALVFCGAGVVTIFIFFMEHYFFGIAGERLTKRVREMMFTAVLRNEIGWFDEHSSSLLASQLSTDATLVRAAIADRLSTVVQNLAMVVTAFIIAFILTWKVSLVVVATYPVLVAAHASEYLFLKGFGGDLTKAYERSSMVAGEAVSNIRTVAAFCAEDKVVELFSRELAKPKVQLFVRGQVAGLGYGVSQFCSYSSYGLSLWYASTLIKNNEVGFGPVIKCFMVLIITALGIAETLALAPDIVKASRAVGSVFEILDRKTEINPDDPSADIIEMVRGAIEFQHVKFSYPSRPDTVIFEDLNLRALPGQTLALVGSSGSGKSSVIALIARFYDPLSGQVTIDGKDIRKLKLRSLRRHIGLVQQEPALFATTIYENILYGRDGATEAEVEEAARSANAHTFISSLPQGYGTEVGERGIQLSGGQKQRVAIARAVLKNPPVLLLDEATSALDAESEHVVQDALDRLMTRRTTIIVAHRLSTIKNADQIAVLEGGCVVEQGSHYELISKAGAYARLISLQGGQQSKPSTSPL